MGFQRLAAMADESASVGELLVDDVVALQDHDRLANGLAHCCQGLTEGGVSVPLRGLRQGMDSFQQQLEPIEDLESGRLAGRPTLLDAFFRLG